MSMLNLSHYDLGDAVGAVPTSFGIGSLTGIATGALYDVGFSDVAFSVGSNDVTIAVVSIILGTILAYVTNDGISVSSLMNRPNWEKAAVLATVAIPVASVFFPGVSEFLNESYVNGTVAAFVMLAGYLTVGYRRARDSKQGLFESVSL